MPAIAFEPLPSCCPTPADWTRARAWGTGIARRQGLRDAERAADLVARVMAAVAVSHPCPHREATPLAGGDPVTEAERRRIRAALVALAAAGPGDRPTAERTVVDVLADAVGDEPRRHAAGGGFTSRVRRVVEPHLHGPVEVGVAVLLINGVQAHEHREPARWVLGESSARDTAAYVVGVVASRRRVGKERTPDPLAGLTVDELAPHVLTARDALVHSEPGRWAGLAAAARVLLRTPLDAADGTDRTAGAGLAGARTAFTDGDVDDGDGDERPVSVRDRDAMEIALERAETEDDLVRLLDDAGLLPADEPRRAAQIGELRPLWRVYERSRRRERQRRG